MIYAETAKEVQARRRAFLRKWRLRCPAVATSLEEAGDGCSPSCACPKPVEVGADHQRDRAPARGVQAPDQDPDRAAVGRDSGDAVLGVARLRPDHDAQGRRLADARRAARTLHTAIMSQRVNWVLDADIRSFFDLVDHEWLLRILAHRIAEPRVLRLVRMWLEAGILESDEWHKTDRRVDRGRQVHREAQDTEQAHDAQAEAAAPGGVAAHTRAAGRAASLIFQWTGRSLRLLRCLPQLPGAVRTPPGGSPHMAAVPPAPKPEGQAPEPVSLLLGVRTLPCARSEDYSPLDDERGMTRVSLGKSRVRESCMPGSVRAKPNGRATRPAPGMFMLPCTACGFWDTGLNPTRPYAQNRRATSRPPGGQAGGRSGGHHRHRRLDLHP